MNDHKPHALPYPNNFPFGLVRITVWKQNSNSGHSGTTYINEGLFWRNERNYYDILINSNLYDWSFDGFNLDYFNRGYIKHEGLETPGLVKLAMWALERWAKDEGFQ